MSKFKVGQKVRIVPWLCQNRPDKDGGRTWYMENTCSGNSVTESMEKARGKIVTILDDSYQYRVTGFPDVHFTDEMLMPIGGSLEEEE